MTIKFHAVLTDECGGEFGADVTADSRDEAYDMLDEDYPESRVVQLESPDDTNRREKAMYDRVLAEEQGDFTQFDYEQEWRA
jgi:hypothetical protein